MSSARLEDNSSKVFHLEEKDEEQGTNDGGVDPGPSGCHWEKVVDHPQQLKHNFWGTSVVVQTRLTYTYGPHLWLDSIGSAYVTIFFRIQDLELDLTCSAM